MSEDHKGPHIYGHAQTSVYTLETSTTSRQHLGQVPG